MSLQLDTYQIEEGYTTQIETLEKQSIFGQNHSQKESRGNRGTRYDVQAAVGLETLKTIIYRTTNEMEIVIETKCVPIQTDL